MAPSADKLKDEGNKAFANKEYKKAAKLYRDAIQLDMYNPVLYANRAQCFLNLNDYKRAYQDSVSGLNLGGSIPITIKLKYRKGLALKGLDRLKDAKISFEQVLEIDPNNDLAKNELKSLTDVDEEMDEVEHEEEINIPIEKVNVLPKEYAEILSSKEEFIEDQIEDTLPEHKPSEMAKKEMDELFGNKSKSNEEIKVPKVDDSPKKEQSPMHFLSSLKRLPEEKKSNGYKYVINLSSEDYENVFGFSGIDTEFLEFFLQAVNYCLKNPQFIPNYNQLSIMHLKQFSKFKRFDLSMMMCDDQIKKQVLQEIKKNHPNDESTYKNLLSI